MDNKPNGVADFDETLAAFGLQGGDPQFNKAMRALFLGRVRQWLHTFYLHDPVTGAIGPDGVRVQLVFEGDPELGQIDPKLLSRMAIGGIAPEQPDGKQLFGLAEIDLRNTKPNNDAVPGLGVFTFSMVRAALAQPIAVTLLPGVLPALGGQPFGQLPSDSKLLGPNLMQTGDSFDPSELLAQAPAFSPLEASYLRRQLLVLP